MALWGNGRPDRLRNNFISNFECTDGNIRCRISLIKQIIIWRNWYTAIESGNTEVIHYIIYMVVGSNPTIIICNGSLAYGDIGFGNGELN